MTKRPVALISAPTLSPKFPSFQLGLLKPTLERAGFEVQCFSLFMYFAAHVGFRLADGLSEVTTSLAGEWIWSKQAFGDFADDDEYVALHRRDLDDVCRRAGCTLADLRRVRERSTATFLDFAVGCTDWSRFGLIGFSVCFQQLVATLALARRLKEAHPEIPIILGGAGFETEIAEEVMRACPYVDMVHCGDADETLPQLIERLYAGASLEGARGVLWRRGGEVRFEGRAPNLMDMNRTPIPDFHEYFYARRESGYEASPHADAVMLPIETARGCWWGDKAHCTFCGLNRAGMVFRARSVDGVVDMLETLVDRHGIHHFNAIDNILEPSYVDGLFGRLREARADLKLHYEIKADVPHDKLKSMHEGGLTSVQPGVESLSTHVLKLIRKGTRAMQNLELIKWCTYYGINNLYNILYGFLGETAEDYDEQTAIVRKIPHLQPPYAFARARADRGSPMFTAPDAHGVRDLRPFGCYRFIFPSDRFDLARVAYFFVHEPNRDLEPAYERLYAEVKAWKERWRRRPRPQLRYRRSTRALQIEDGRGPKPLAYTYRGEVADLYEHCADARARRAITERFGDAPWVEEALEGFLARDLMVCLDRCYLSLALPANPYL